ncbi:MAG: D-alanyl-D-alanine carboxypeptidase family protein [Ruminococcaceae bacterium]|nr:D-alanyl-D-alanine carboxypeptidase family protein [Oscillospiraceae bacterium]
MDTKPTMQVAHGTAETSAMPPHSAEPEVQDKRKKMLVAVSFILAIAIMLCFCVTIVAEIIDKINGGSGRPAFSNGPVKYIEESYSSDDVHKGDLILVKEGYKYSFPSDDDIVQILANKNSSYIVRNGNQTLDANTLEQFNKFMIALEADTGFSDVQIYNGYRSYETQRDKYEGYEDEVKAGYSEHHTGTAFDINIYVSANYFKKLTDNPEVYNYIISNAHKYGFIDRYPDAKKDITGVEHDFTMKETSRPTHLRYVGYAHAYYMSQNDLCLEEYLDELRTNYSYEGKHLNFVGDNGNTYEVYYVASSAEQTKVPVPTNYDYTVSGDNMNGFIVTVCTSAKG